MILFMWYFLNLFIQTHEKNEPVEKKDYSKVEIVVAGQYCAKGVKNPYDAVHAFNRRVSDGFGGYINQKIDSALLVINQMSLKSDIKSLDIQIDPLTLTVSWIAIIGESYDKNSYVEFDSRGSAGGGVSAIKKQLPKMNSKHPGKNPVKIMELNVDLPMCFDYYGREKSCDGNINIKQWFYKYY